ncbi:uncharacterized protein METZ01_LOCUS18639 [marine metagenome]|uniref:Uncharacterized protein n=1 Tax=marine metagenome TaxID=408172 RepID=A0A381PFK1_9ZZZZ
MSFNFHCSNYSVIQLTFFRRFLSYWTAFLLLSFVTVSCASGAFGSGKFYDWCTKRDFPAICKKYLD